jgi:hypothetical protein
MELLDRYLEAVKKHLPWQRQDDIIAELRANLEAQLEDKEAELNRPLTQGEAEDWLRQIGKPMQVAARYQPQQYLIGPTVFPIYWFVMRLALFWTFVIYSIVTAVEILTGPLAATAVVEAVLHIPWVLMITAAIVTLNFAVVEFVSTHYPTKLQAMYGKTCDWSPSALPPVEKGATPGKKPRSYAHAVAEVIFGFIFLVWWLLVPAHPYLLMGPGAGYLKASPFQLAPFWVQFYWWVVALNTLQLGWRTVDLMRGSWRGSRRGQQIATGILGLIPLFVLFTVRDHAFVLLKHPELDLAQHGAALDSINRAIAWSVNVILVIAVLGLLWEIGQICVDAYRSHATKMK